MRKHFRSLRPLPLIPLGLLVAALTGGVPTDAATVDNRYFMGHSVSSYSGYRPGALLFELAWARSGVCGVATDGLTTIDVSP